MDPMSNLTFSEHQTQLEKGARTASKRLIPSAIQSERCQPRCGRGLAPGALAGFLKAGAWYPCCTEGAGNVVETAFVVVVFSGGFFSVEHTPVCCVTDANTHTFIFDTSCHIGEKGNYDFMNTKQ